MTDIELFEILNPFTYKRFLDSGYKITDQFPEDRCPMPNCNCGGDKFIFFVSNTNVYARCINCGKYNPMTPKIGKDFRKTNDYRNFKQGVYERYGNKCAFCEKTTDLQVHHIVPFQVCDELKTRKNNGILLCRKCHKLVHKCMKPIKDIGKLEFLKETI